MKIVQHRYFIIFCFCSFNLMLRLLADANSGFQGDELLHIATGNHPAFGYMEFPPMIGWMAWLQNQFHSSSVFVHHIFTHIASTLIFILTAAIVQLLGGRNRAIIIALMCLSISPGFGRSFQLFQPTLFTQLFWLLGFYQLLRFILTLKHKYLYYLAVSCAFGFLAKYDIVFFIAGLTSLFFFKPTRQQLLGMVLPLSIALWLVLISPNLWWQYQHDFPVFQHFTELYKSQLDKIDFPTQLGKLVVALNPFAVIIYLGGLYFMFNSNNKPVYRPLAISILVSIGLLIIGKGKFYYFFPIMITLLCFGSIWFAQLTYQRFKWAFYTLGFFFILSGAVLIPYGLAVLPLQGFIKFARVKKENGLYEIKNQEYYSKQTWKEIMAALQKTYHSLPPTEQKNCLIWGKHYRQAGAVSLFHQEWGIPDAFSYHGSFYLWAPTGQMPSAVIAFNSDDSGQQFWMSYFDSVTPVAHVVNQYSKDLDDGQHRLTIYICKKPKQDFNGLKEIFKKRIFE
ncbi:glycosyltransferase family 39 protein [Pedobacter sp. Hv1]|uniref:ArnT family glycosyltransferase n=1 Tax=Pedobacter sp. Hv1 TaxID=1740090 RepID=UPI0009EBCF00|nr:glycosyltransferase family 39 protein [Pedobacter sp. Hv1]